MQAFPILPSWNKFTYFVNWPPPLPGNRVTTLVMNLEEKHHAHVPIPRGRRGRHRGRAHGSCGTH